MNKRQIELHANAVAERLMGQCSVDIEQALAEVGQPRDGEVERAAYKLVFECDTCNWWCSTDELNNDTGDALCDDCVDDEVEGS